MPVGAGSVTVVPAALTLPVLLATIVYVIVPFGVSVVVGELFWILTCGVGATVTVQAAAGEPAGQFDGSDDTTVFVIVAGGFAFAVTV